MKKIILHLCADIGSDTKPYQDDPNYDVILVGKKEGVQNFEPPKKVHGIFANPPCTEFSRARSGGKPRDPQKGMILVDHCLRIIRQCNPVWWALENPAQGALRQFLGPPVFVYQPWQYGSPWTKRTALWGVFRIPPPFFDSWDEVPKNPNLYVKPKRKKPSLIDQHKTMIKNIPEFRAFEEKVKDNSGFRSLCSQHFARAFFDQNK